MIKEVTMKKRLLAVTLSVLMAGTALAGCGGSYPKER